MKAASSLGYRPDIDGLRAIAVIGVVLFHAYPQWVKGGFIGVDLFFVISGYLISSIILRELDVGAFSLRDFYARRIRRLFPALLLVLVSYLAFGAFMMLSFEYRHLAKHVVTSTVFVQNLALMRESGNYFGGNSEEKPLMHLWSLGVEEQFYLIWPVLLVVLYRSRQRVLYWVIGIGLASFALNVYWSFEAPREALHSPTHQGWRR